MSIQAFISSSIIRFWFRIWLAPLIFCFDGEQVDKVSSRVENDSFFVIKLRGFDAMKGVTGMWLATWSEVSFEAPLGHPKLGKSIKALF